MEKLSQWSEIQGVLWGLAFIIYILGFLEKMVQDGEKWMWHLVTAGFLLAITLNYTTMVTSFITMNQTEADAITKNQTVSVDSIFKIMRDTKIKEKDDASFSSKITGMLTYVFRQTVDDVLYYICRICIFVGQIAKYIPKTIIRFTLLTMKIVAPLSISFFYLSYTKSISIKFLTLSLSLCLTPYAFVIMDMLVMYLFAYANAWITGSAAQDGGLGTITASAISIQMLTPGGPVGTGATIFVAIGAFLALSVVLTFISVGLYLMAPIFFISLLTGENPTSAFMGGAILGTQMLQTAISTATSLGGNMVGGANQALQMGGNSNPGNPPSNPPSGGGGGGNPPTPPPPGGGQGAGTPKPPPPPGGAPSAGAGAGAGAGGAGASAGAGAAATVATAGLAAPVAIGMAVAGKAMETAGKAMDAGMQTAQQVGSASAGMPTPPPGGSMSSGNSEENGASSSATQSDGGAHAMPGPSMNSFNAPVANNPDALSKQFKTLSEDIAEKGQAVPQTQSGKNYNHRQR